VVTMENICRHLVNKNFSLTVISAISGLYTSLHHCGMQLDTMFKDQLDKLMAVFRTACRDDDLDLVARVQILHIIELRAAGWVTNDNMVAYYKQKLSHIEVADKRRESPQIQTAPVSLNANAPDFTPTVGHSGACLLLPGEVVGSSGKFNQPTKIPGKNYFKDEVVIRNADSGKVMGLKGRRVHMIEQLTETVVSFQRVVPGARERLVQITGPGYDNIVQAKLLIEETIRRNQSPTPRDDIIHSPMDSNDSDSRRNTLIAPDRECVPLDEYKYTVNVGDECVRITGASLDLVRTAKLVLEEYFSLGDTVNDMNKILLKDTKPSRASFQVGPPETMTPPGGVSSNTLPNNTPHKSAFENLNSKTVTDVHNRSNPEVSEESQNEVALIKPSVSYTREQLLTLAMTAKETIKNSMRTLDEMLGITKREANLVFDPKTHLEMGLSLFHVPDYVKSFNASEDE